MSMLAAVLFDMGSTLIHTDHSWNWGPALQRMQADLLAHLSQQLAPSGRPLDAGLFNARFGARVAEFGRQRQTDWVEYTTAWILRSTLEEMGLPPPAPAALDQALAAYYAYNESLWFTVPGAPETLAALRAQGLRLGLISNAADGANVRRLLAAAGLLAFFDPLLISAEVGLRKPNPRIFELALQAWGLPPEACAMVGDSLGADILGAQLAGLRAVWFSAYADRDANRQHHGHIRPDAEIRRLADLPALLSEWRGDPR